MAPSNVPSSSLGHYPERSAGPWRRLPTALVMGGDEQAGRFAVEALTRASCRVEIGGEGSDGPLTPDSQDFILLQGEAAGADPVLRLRERGFWMPILLTGSATDDPDAWGPEAGIVERLPTPYTLQSLRDAIARLGVPLPGRGRSF